MHIELHLWRTGACYHVHIVHCTVSWLVQTSLYGLTSLTLNASLGSYHQKHKTKCAPIGNSCMDLKLVVDQVTSSSYKSLIEIMVNYIPLSCLFLVMCARQVCEEYLQPQ
jgi:hypothetical protein